jgi:hypothetical protein
MRLDDTIGSNVDKSLRGMVIIFNATTNTTTQSVSAVAGQKFQLDPIQQDGSDPVVRTAKYTAATGTFTVPARTVAVFVAH